MDEPLQAPVRRLKSKRKARRIIRKIAGVMGCIVAFVTTYALILPAITMERTTFCGADEHIHNAACYQQQVEICEQICTIHVHDDTCYAVPELEPVLHSHKDTCTEAVKGDLICDLPESDEHSHSDVCYYWNQIYSCGLEEGQPEAVDPVLICSEQEVTGHVHAEDCFQIHPVAAEPICGQSHEHTYLCYQMLCSLTEHTHSLQSRFYNPTTGRFLNADAFAATGQGLLGNNMFAYCNNNPVIHKDSQGTAVETVFDLITLGLSVAEVIANPADLGAWIGLAGDAIDLIPFVTGVGETVRGLRIADKFDNVVEIADSLGDSIDTYRDVRKVTKGTGLEAHHILEKRFVNPLKIATNKSATDMLSIPLTKTQHQAFTNAWRKAPLSYGNTASLDAVVKRGVEIYGNDPRLMRAFILTLSKH